jgi:hypothetical protein
MYPRLILYECTGSRSFHDFSQVLAVLLCKNFGFVLSCDRPCEYHSDCTQEKSFLAGRIKKLGKTKNRTKVS